MTALSVLDLAFVTTDAPPAAALHRSVELAKAVDALGYTRFWVAEHHNLPSVACSTPDVLIGQIAAATQRIRVGAGGIMLPNHAPLMVAERFKSLEAFFPGRIDLGLGRAPGTDQVTAYALRRRDGSQQEGGRPDDDFLERLQELMAWDKGDFPPQHPFKQIAVMPDGVPLPPLWLLGSSDYSARLSAQLGLRFAFAHHFAGFDAAAALRGYRAAFEPSPSLERPYSMLTVAVIAGESAAEAERLASSADLNALRRARGEFRPLPSPDEAAQVTLSQEERAFIGRNRARLFVGTPDRVHAELAELIAVTQADEVMITTPVFDPKARQHSYALLADAFGLTRSGISAAA